MKKFFVIAGEASGDVLGAKLIRQIRAEISGEEVKFVGVGGKMMEKEGFSSIFDMNELSVMGFFEILPHLFKILRRIDQVAAEIIKQKPDYVITIDSPDFNFRVMKKIRDFKGCKKIHMIAPSVWAYREGRAKKIAKLYDLLLTILPFEPPYFTKYGLKAVFIGHPIMENAPDFSQKTEERARFRQKYSFYEEDCVIYVTPGSRISEVKKIFDEFIEAINLLKDKVANLSIVVGVTDKTKEIVTEMAKNFEVKYVLAKKDEKQAAFFASDFALAKSGTNTLEASLYKLPMIICYKVNLLTYYILKILVKIRFANLVNLIMNRLIIPELLQADCNAQNIAKNLQYLIENDNIAKDQIEQSQASLRLMGLGFKEIPTKKAVQEILKL
jgi:lipid-A-disaccharide synthase